MSPRHLRRSAVIALVLGSALAVFPVAAASAVPLPTGSITGTVEDAFGDPIDGAQVFLASATHSYDVVTGPSGEFAFSDIPAGTYGLAAASAGHASFNGGTPLTVAVARGETVVLTPVLGEYSSLSGVVTDASANPVPGVTVHLARTDIDSGLVATTDALGSYSITGIPPVDHTLRFQAPGGSGLISEWRDDSLTLAGAEILSFPSTGGASVLNAELGVSAVEISGVVTFEGVPHPGAFVVLSNADGDEIGTAVTAADGSYATAGLVPGTYAVAAWWYDGTDEWTSEPLSLVVVGDVSDADLVLDTVVDREPLTVTGGPDSYETTQDTVLTTGSPGVLANDSSASAEALTTSIVDLPEHGELFLAFDGSFTYAPDDGFVGTDTFVYETGPEGEGSGPVTVTITVAATLPATGAAAPAVAGPAAVALLAAGAVLGIVAAGRRRRAHEGG